VSKNKYPCDKCKIKKGYAKLDFHWFDYEDCPFVCPYVKKEKVDGKEDEGK
jgi:hypothetical protein